MSGFDMSGGISGLIETHGALFLVLLLWSGFWKGLALWHAGRRGMPWWFAALFVINSVGILELLFLFVICRLKPSQLFSK